MSQEYSGLNTVKAASGDAGLVIKAYSRSARPRFYGWATIMMVGRMIQKTAELLLTNVRSFLQVRSYV